MYVCMFLTILISIQGGAKVLGQFERLHLYMYIYIYEAYTYALYICQVSLQNTFAPPCIFINGRKSKKKKQLFTLLKLPQINRSKLFDNIYVNLY